MKTNSVHSINTIFVLIPQYTLSQVARRTFFRKHTLLQDEDCKRGDRKVSKFDVVVYWNIVRAPFVFKSTYIKFISDLFVTIMDENQNFVGDLQSVLGSTL